MKIIVFGATGGVGLHVVKQALDHGMQITAFVRTPSKLTFTHDRLQVIQGDAFHKEEVAAAIAGHDAVVSCLGSSQGIKKIDRACGDDQTASRRDARAPDRTHHLHSFCRN